MYVTAAFSSQVAGTKDEVTAVQLDVKYPSGVPVDVLCEAIGRARDGRRQILEEMGKVKTRPAIKESAPQVQTVRYDPARKKDLVGPGGAVMKQLEEAYGISLDLSQEGQCLIYGAQAKAARDAVNELDGDVEIGEVYGGGGPRAEGLWRRYRDNEEQGGSSPRKRAH